MHRCWSCQDVFFNHIFLTSLCQSPVCIHTFFKKIHFCLVVHEYKHDLPFKENPPHAWSHAADSCLLRLLLFSLHSPAKEVLMGVSHCSSCWLKFTSHLHHCSGCPHPNPPVLVLEYHVGASIPIILEKYIRLCWQPLTVKQEDGELHETSGIHDRYFHDWLKRERERHWRREEGKGGGCYFLKGRRSFHFKRTQIEWEIPPCVKYLESVSVCCW